MAKWVYLFKEGDASMRNLLGGKGANLAEMTNIGLPVPQGFTITTIFIILGAGFRRDGESLRNRKSQAGHLSQVRALAA